jgi:hypothetical protein
LVPQNHEQGRPGRSLCTSLDLRGRAILLGKLRAGDVTTDAPDFYPTRNVTLEAYDQNPASQRKGVG